MARNMKRRQQYDDLSAEKKAGLSALSSDEKMARNMKRRQRYADLSAEKKAGLSALSSDEKMARNMKRRQRYADLSAEKKAGLSALSSDEKMARNMKRRQRYADLSAEKKAGLRTAKNVKYANVSDERKNIRNRERREQDANQPEAEQICKQTAKNTSRNKRYADTPVEIKNIRKSERREQYANQPEAEKICKQTAKNTSRNKRYADTPVEIKNIRKSERREQYAISRATESSSEFHKFNQYICATFSQECHHCNILMYSEQTHNVCTVSCSGNDTIITVCGKCKKYVEKRQIAPWAWENDMDPGCVPHELAGMNCMEIRMISQAIPFMKVVSLRGGQLSEIGQAISFPVSIQDLHSSLPRDIKDSGLFCLLPSSESIDCNSSEVLARHIVHYVKVITALEWLKLYNPLYSSVDTQMVDDTDISTSDNDINTDSLLLRESCAFPSSYSQPDVDLKQILHSSNVPTVSFPVITAEPKSTFKDDTLEELCFPHIFPYGINGFCTKRTPSPSDLMYFQSRLLNVDSRWRTDIGWVFWALNTYEIRKLFDTISIVSRMRTNQSGSSLTAGSVSTSTDDFICNSYAFMKNIRGTAAYWREELHKLLARINCLGPPTWFMTLSADDLHWPDLYMTLDRSLTYDDACQLSPDIKRKLLISNPVFAAIHFHRRGQALMKFVLRSKSAPLGKIKDFWYRVEFQMRGSPHLHMFLWIEGAPDIETVQGMRDAPSFIDRYVSTSIPIDVKMSELVKRLQIHSHTTTCRKRDMSCRFHFPRIMCNETRLKTNVDLRSCAQFYETKRSDDDKWVNAYNPVILSTWQANMDLQMVGSKYAAAYYVCSYVSKAEPENMKHAMSQLLKSMPSDATQRQKLSKIGNLVLSHRQISAQEVAFRLCGLQLVSSSRTTVWINARPPNKRCRLLRPISEISQLNDQSSDIFMPGLAQYYALRPTSREDIDWINMSLSHFAANYTILPNCPRSTERTLPSYKLTDINKWAKQKQKPAIINSNYTTSSDGDDYYYHLLYLYHPWRKESELTEGYTSARAAFDAKQSTFDQALPSFCVAELARAIQQLRLLHSDVFDVVAPNTAHEFQNDEILDEAWTINNADLATSSHSFSACSNVDDATNIHDSSQQWETLAMYTMSTEEFNSNIKSLSPDQAHVMRTIQTHYRDNNAEPLRLFVTGGAGCGKSFVIKLINEYLLRSVSKPGFPCVVLTAPTGVSAFNIHAQTLHSALCLPVEHIGGAQYLPLTNKKLAELRRAFQHVNTVIIDEISMVSYRSFEYIHSRLNEIKDTAGDLGCYFGNLNIITFGDLYQLKPVFGSFIFKEISWSECHLWKSFFRPLFLTANHRQTGDARFTELLNNIRIGIPTSADIELLSSRIMTIEETNEEPFTSALRIFSTRSECDLYNKQALDTLVNSNKVAVTHIKASLRLIDGPPQYDNTSDFSDLISERSSDTAGLYQVLDVAIGARVMLVRNILSCSGLVNGARGVITEFVWQEGNSENDSTLPTGIFVKFDDPEIGKVLQNSTEHESILIRPITVRFFGKLNSVFHMTQLPLISCYATTVHKVQGLSLDYAVIDLGETIFTSGQAYVALSRLRKLDGLALLSLSQRKIMASKIVHDEMVRLLNLFHTNSI